VSCQCRRIFFLSQFEHTNCLFRVQTHNESSATNASTHVHRSVALSRSSYTGWPFSRHCESYWRFAALLPMWSGTHIVPVQVLLSKMTQWLHNDERIHPSAIHSNIITQSGKNHIVLCPHFHTTANKSTLHISINSFWPLFSDTSETFCKIPDSSGTAVKIPDISRFSTQVVTLLLSK